MGEQARPADRSWIIPTLLNLEATEGRSTRPSQSRLVEQGLNGRGCAARASVVRVVASRILVSCQALLMFAEHFFAPLVRLLLGLTFVTGVVDAVSFLFLGRVFVPT